MAEYSNPAAEMWHRENLMDPEKIPFSFRFAVRLFKYHKSTFYFIKSLWHLWKEGDAPDAVP